MTEYTDRSTAAERAGIASQRPGPIDRQSLTLGLQVRSWLDCHRQSLLDSLQRLGRQPFGSFFTCLVMAVTLCLPMGLALLLDNLEQLGGSWKKAAQVSLYVTPGLSESAGESLRDQVLTLSDVAEAEWISPAAGLATFEAESGFGRALQDLPENPLPGVVVVTPQEVDRQRLDQLLEQLGRLEGVEQVQLDMQWVERLMAILHLGDRFVFGISLLLIATLLLVVGNTIRLHIENRRIEIEVVKLVGGTDGYVRRPFLYMGALYGLGAGLLAWLLLAYGLEWLNQGVVRLSGLYDSRFELSGIPLKDGTSLLLGALLLGYVGAWLAVGRHLSELSPK